MPGTEFRITKKKTPVEIVCSDGADLIGFLFIGQQARLSDTLNDGRQFLPFENALGEVTMLRKIHDGQDHAAGGIKRGVYRCSRPCLAGPAR